MSNKAVANRYAVALFELGVSKGQANEFEQDLALVRDVFNQTPELLKVLETPGLSQERKAQVIKQSFQGNVQETTLALLLTLVEKNRYTTMPELLSEYKRLNNELKGIAEATVYSAKPISDSEKEQIAVVFAPKVGKRSLEVTNVVQEQLVGGIKVRIGDRVYDGSVKGQLDRLEKGILAGK
ncbi:F0F1 ATP synthase subunit delta [Shouchella miscanthi]|uniref:ATP synthase subunit delta n=1 Tax=Shouchella miscanthi TaxID=2598861 RepID=A0ABU6NJE9_9BACI|nr:F0F1 ATP synthase subunit delta [Shouchella miscanthi]